MAVLVSLRVEDMDADLFGSLTNSNGQEDVVLNPLTGRLSFNMTTSPGQRVFITYKKI